MESKHETTSVILKLMGLDEVPPQHPVTRDTPKVLSEKYLQKVASIGVRKKRLSCQHHSFRMSTDEKEGSEDAFKVVKTIRRDKHHNPSKGNGKEEGVRQKLLNASCMSDNRKPQTFVDAIGSFNLETNVNTGRMVEQGNLQLQQQTDNRLQEDVRGETGLYETYMFPKSQLDLKDETLSSRITVLKANPGKGGNGIKYFSFLSSFKSSHLASGLPKEIFCTKIMRVYPERKDRKKMPYHMEQSSSFNKVSDEVSIQMGNVANKVLDTVSSSFFIGNGAFAKGSESLNLASTISVNEIQCNPPFFCSDGSYVGSEAKNRTLKQRDTAEKLHEVDRRSHASSNHQLPMISEHGNGARNFSYQSGFSNDKITRDIRSKVGVNYNFARKVPMARSLCTADNHGTITKDNLFQKYWGLRKNASANWSTLKSKYQNINQKDCSEAMNLRSSSEKSPSFSSYFNNDHIEENCIGLPKLKKRCYGTDLSVKKPMLPQLSRSGPYPTFMNSEILQETCLMNKEANEYKHDDSNMSKQSRVSPNSSVDCLVSDVKMEVVGRSHDNPTKRQSESTAFIWLHEDNDSLSHTSYASMQQDTTEFQEDSGYSLCSGTEPDSLNSFEEAYEPSPISVLDLSFREDISSSSEYSKDDCGDVYDSSELDNEGFGLNVSSDEDCGDESMCDFKEKQDLIGLFKAEESRDYSYLVEVLTEAGNSNRSLFTDFSTWHSAECPISPSVFENMEKKFGEQQLWKRSERRLLFDRINLGLLEILQPCSYIPTWEKPVSRRMNAEPSQDMIEEEVWGLLISQEKEASKESADKMLGGEIRWIELGDDIEVIVREIVKLLIEELANEIVSLENF